MLGTQQPGAIQVQVIDHGAGMSPEDTTRIFQQFYRSPTARMSTVPGLGMGLALSKDIVDAHGGTLTCHSALGEGSIFTLTLPIHARPDDTQDPGVPSGPPAARHTVSAPG